MWYKNHHKCKRDYSWNPSTCNCENIKYLKSITDTSVIKCDEIISAMDIVSSEMINIIVTNAKKKKKIKKKNIHSKTVI